MNMFGFGDPRVDGGGWIRTPHGWVWVPPWRPWGVDGWLQSTSEGWPGGGPIGDPRIDGGWRPWEQHPALSFLDALHGSLDDKSEESFRKALGSPEHTATVARLYTRSSRKSTQALRQRLAVLQAELPGAGARKPAILREIADILEQLGE